MIDGRGWVDKEHEIGYAYDQYCDAFENSIEKLMLEVCVFVVSAGRNPEAEEYHLKNINDMLQEKSIRDLLFLEKKLTDDIETLLTDLKLINNLSRLNF